MQLTPTHAHERIESLDIIRGFALFGIFLVNMPAFQWPEIVGDSYMLSAELNEVDQWIRLFFDVFIQAKFYTIFSFLFGVGFYIFMKRAETKGFNYYVLFSKRVTVLAMFGFLHLTLLWYGDILLTYAVAGFFLMFFYKRKAKTMVVWIVTLFLLVSGVLSLHLIIPQEWMEEVMLEVQDEGREKVEEAIDVYQNASFGEWISYRWDNEVIPVLENMPFSVPAVLLMFLIGLYASKRGIFHDFPAHRTFVQRAMIVSLLASLPFTIGIVSLHFGWWAYGIMTHYAIRSLLYISGIFLSLFYICVLLFLLEKETWRRLLKPFSYAGRLALTNYIMQTLVGVGIYKGLGLFGEVNLLIGTMICSIVFPLQMVFSYLWLKKYKFGPLEWVWRKLTYSGTWKKTSSTAKS